MTVNKLKLNDEKPEALLIGPFPDENRLNWKKKLALGSSSIAVSNSAQNLGVIFD